MKALPYKHNTSYRVPVAVGDVVEDISCGTYTPTLVTVVKLFDWGLRVRTAGDFDYGWRYDCTRWRRREED